MWEFPLSGRIGPSAWLWTIAAMGGLLWGVIAVVVAAVGPPEMVPRVFYSFHVEHFAAFYVLAILASTAFPRVPLSQITAALSLMALILATFRLLAPRHQTSNIGDLMADIAGVLAALAPILVGRFRRMVVEERRTHSDP